MWYFTLENTSCSESGEGVLAGELKIWNSNRVERRSVEIGLHQSIDTIQAFIDIQE